MFSPIPLRSVICQPDTDLERASGGDVSASPLVADARLCFISEEGFCIKIEAASEFKHLATNQMEELTLAWVVPIDAVALVRTAMRLFRTDRALCFAKNGSQSPVRPAEMGSHAPSQPH